MHTDPNARLTSLGRERFIRRHIDEHDPLAELAGQAGISLRTAYKWGLLNKVKPAVQQLM